MFGTTLMRRYATARHLFGVLMMLALFVLTACGGSPQRATSKGFDGTRADSVQTESASAFGGDSNDGDDFGGAAAPMAPMEPMADNAPAEMGDAPGGETTRPEPAPTKHDGDTGADEPKQATGPLLIYTADYKMAVYEVTDSIDAVQALAKKTGGYLVRRDNRSITIRVPAKKYRSTLGNISKLGDVLHHAETVDDVTEQFFDMKTRLDNARAMRIRLQELLAAAKDVEDALAVEKELARVTETIERIEGKLKRLRELINFSTITVQFSGRGGEHVNSNVKLPFSWLGQLGLGPLLQLR